MIERQSLTHYVVSGKDCKWHIIKGTSKAWFVTRTSSSGPSSPVGPFLEFKDALDFVIDSVQPNV